MNKRFLWIPALLLIGFLLGGLTYYFIIKASTPYYKVFTPNVPQHIEETSRAFSEIVIAVSPAVVNISSTKVIKRQSPFDDFFDFFHPAPDKSRKWKEQSLGSGVIVSNDGYIVTNNHVIEQSEEIKVTLFDKRTFKARVIGSDPKSDIAVIKIDSNGLPTLTFGDSNKLQVGEFVLAIGNPFGLNHTVTMGIISAVGRANVGIADYEDFIQTDAAINPGNSGGPLVNIKGELIGINTAIFSRTGGFQGIGFSVPSNMVRFIINQLIKEGKVTRGWLGVTIQDLTPEIAQKFGINVQKGVLVSDITKNSPAQRAGMLRGDIILEFDGKEVSDVATLKNMVAQSMIGASVSIKVLRQNRELTLKAIIKELPASKTSEIIPSSMEDTIKENALSGIAVMDLNAAISKQLGLSHDEKGVVIIKIDSDSPAESSEIKKGDVIQEIDRQKVENINDFNRIVSNIKGGDTVLLYINRNGRKFYVALKPK
jgi:serine protease Do